MKVALVHDWLPLMGGAEKVLAGIYELYPSTIYTLIKDEKKLKETVFEKADIKTSFIQRLPFGKTQYRNYLPFFPLAIEQFNLSGYDLIISSSYAVAKGVLTNANQLHICYCHSPARYAWDLYHPYLKEAKLSTGIKGAMAKIILHYIRMWDILSINRVDYFIANSHYIAKRIKRVYNMEAIVIYPPVDVDKFELCTNKEDFYLTASRMVNYKRIDLIVEAFSKMPDKTLIVIGDGPEFKKIKSQATKNIKILGYQPFEVLKNYMQRAKAFVFAAEEDFGIIPVEAQACGTPVIAFKKGGAMETIIDQKTGLFFNLQQTTSIIDAVNEFENKISNFDPSIIRASVEKFSKQRFQREMKEFIENKYSDFTSLNTKY